MNYKWIMLIVSILLCLSGAKAAGQDTMLQQNTQELLQALPDEAGSLLQNVDLGQTAENWNKTMLHLFQSIDTQRFLSSALRSLTKMMVVAVAIGGAERVAHCGRRRGDSNCNNGRRSGNHRNSVG